jgi:glycosyltransferase involved in cell wall biosynthesis
LKLAYFSPVNPVQSGISDYSEELLPALARYAEIDLYLDNDLKPSNPALAKQFATYPASKFSKQVGRYDSYLFHMGNSAAHAYIYRALLEHGQRGVLVLHDFVLHHFLMGQYLNHGRAQEYIRVMGQRYGKEGEATAREVIKGKLPEVLFQYPLCDEAIEAASAVLVHSQYSKNLIEKSHPGKTVGVARMGVPLPPNVDKKAARERLGLPQNEFILTSLGHLNPYKRLDSALWAFRAFSREFPNSRYILVGSPSPNYNIRAMVRALGLEKRVEITGYASGEKYADYLAASDVCVNLRYPTAGETSASLLRIMGAGRPVLVSRTGAFVELPDDTCIKVDVDDAEEELLLEYLRLLARRPEVAAELGYNARRYVAEQARLSDAAHDYYLFLCQILGQPATIAPEEIPIETVEAVPVIYTVEAAEADKPSITSPQTLLEEIAQAAAELDFAEDSPALAKVAEVIKEVS